METVQFWWDSQDPSNAGWYARVLDESGREIDDSMKRWFPVDVEQFSEYQSAELAESLGEAFPESIIEAR